MKRSRSRYDIIVYGLLDSHTLLSGMSGVRLDSYVYTVEALRDARDLLSDNGFICLTFAVLNPELGRKIFLMLKDAFDGIDPVVFDTGYDLGVAYIMGSSAVCEQVKAASNDLGIEQVTQRYRGSTLKVDESTDDWPFFYMTQRKYPTSYVGLLFLLAYLSLVSIRGFLSLSASGFSIPCFFLGAGFMLIETKGITELALVFGSTWIVISVVIASILFLAYLANLMILKRGNQPRWCTYGALFCSILLGMFIFYFVDLDTLPSPLARTIATALLTIPLFFSGLAFSSELKASASVATALSANLLGAMVGGLLEYNSMYFGYKSLYFIALLMYALAALSSRARA